MKIERKRKTLAFIVVSVLVALSAVPITVSSAPSPSDWTVAAVNNPGAPALAVNDDLVAGTDRIVISTPGFEQLPPSALPPSPLFDTDASGWSPTWAWFGGANWNGVKLTSPAGFAGAGGGGGGYSAGDNRLSFNLSYSNTLAANGFYVEVKGYDATGDELIYDAQTTNASANDNPVAGLRNQQMDFWFAPADAAGLDYVEITIRANNKAYNSPIYLTIPAFGSGTMPVGAATTRSTDNLASVMVTDKYTNKTVLTESNIVIPAEIFTANANANQTTRNLLGYLKAVADSPYVLWGEQNPDVHNGDWSWMEIRNRTPYPGNSDNYLMDLIGARPAVMGIDGLGLMGHEFSINADPNNRIAGLVDWTARWTEEYNGIINVTQHMPNFARMIDIEGLAGYEGSYLEYFQKGEANYGGSGGVNYSCNGIGNINGVSPAGTTALGRIMPGGDANRAYREYMDIIIEYALGLQARGISFLYRPFHEFNGNFFWWGNNATNSGGQAALHLAWIYTFEYFQEHGVNNAIWCWGWNNIPANVATMRSQYPGSDYVDMLCFDQYMNFSANYTLSTGIQNGVQRISEFADEMGKVAAIGEYGMYRASAGSAGTDERIPDFHLRVLREALGRNNTNDAPRAGVDAKIAFMLTWDYDLYYPWMTSATRGSNGASAFIGGFANESGSVFTDGTFTFDQIKNLNVAAVNHEVSFEDWDGTSLGSQIVARGDAAVAPVDPVRPGYYFLGWFLGGDEYDFASAVSGDITLTAKWTGAVISITGPAEVASGGGAVASYTISAKYMPQVSGIELEFEVDGDYLSSKEFNALGGFEFFGTGNYGTDIFWKNSGNIWTGKVTLLDLNTGGINGDADLLSMAFNVKEGVLGTADIKLNYVKMSAANNAVVVTFANDTFSTDFVQYYSPYDLNKDGVIDLNDLTYALQFLLMDNTDPNWDDIKAIDFSGDGKIGVEDLVLILANYTIPYYS